MLVFLSSIRPISPNPSHFFPKNITAVSVRWQHCIDHAADKQTKAVNVARLTSRCSSAADRQSVKRDYLGS